MIKLLILLLMRLLLMVVAIVIIATGGCTHVKHKQAVEFYDQHVQHFPE
jgi:hypothetical protein